MKKGNILAGDSKRYFFWVIVVIMIFLSYLILKPYIVALISAFVLAYLVRPVYTRLEKKMDKNLAAAICVFLVIVIVILPFVIVAGEVTRQSYSYFADGEFKVLLKETSNKISTRVDLEQWSEKGVNFIVSLLSGAAKRAPSFIISIFVALFGLFTFLVNWEKLAGNLRKYIPFANKEKIVKEIGQMTNALVYGTLLIGIIEFFVAAIGFYISGTRFFFLLAVLIFFFAFIPGLGPGIVWVPMAIYNLATGNYFALIIVLITGAILSFGIDFALRSKILGDNAKINPLIVLVGVIGGISVFGVFGFIIGPLILTYTIKILQEGFSN